MEQKTPSSEEKAAFFLRVYEIVRQIPRGKVVTYGQIAWLIGNPRAARLVGFAMRRCPEDLPWQRVVMADGTITGGGFGVLREALLREESVPFTPDGRVDLEKCRWDPED